MRGVLGCPLVGTGCPSRKRFKDAYCDKEPGFLLVERKCWSVLKVSEVIPNVTYICHAPGCANESLDKQLDIFGTGFESSFFTTALISLFVSFMNVQWNFQFLCTPTQTRIKMQCGVNRPFGEKLKEGPIVYLHRAIFLSSCSTGQFQKACYVWIAVVGSWYHKQSFSLCHLYSLWQIRVKNYIKFRQDE